MRDTQGDTRTPVGLGIDVGGTFSDSVLVELPSGQVLSKAKSPTTHDDLVTGIEQSVGLLDRSLFSNIKLVSLSTTLATNALVEGRRSHVAVILAGYEPAQYPREFLRDIFSVRGGHTAEGEEATPLDTAEIKRIIEATGNRVEAYAVSSYFSTRNPSHELEIRELIEKYAPGIPVVCGYELSGKLNAKRRAITTILNAHLIPLIRVLLFSVKKVLHGFDINAPLMVVKGDGSLFREADCLQRPVETILSGPAASVVGAGFLMDQSGHFDDKSVVMDIGGTTSDIALLEKGYPKVNENGVSVGPWHTHVSAVDVRTLGLGGDSHIRMDTRKEILIGPKRVKPICFLGKDFPGLQSQLTVILEQTVRDPRFTPVAFWFRTEKPVPESISDRERRILNSFTAGPLNIDQICDKLDVYAIAIKADLERMENHGLIRMSGFTPTDIFHIRGLFQEGSRECSLLAAQFMAKRRGMGVEAFLAKVDEVFQRNATLNVLEALSSHPVPYTREEQDCPACQQIWRNCFWLREKKEKQAKIGLFRMDLKLEAPLVAIGAPAHILIPPMGYKIGAETFIPEHAEVANALGAIVGSILVQEQVLIRPLSPSGYACFTSEKKSVFPTLDEAVDHARLHLDSYLRAEVRSAGGEECEMTIWEDRKQAALSSGEEMVIEVILHGQAVAKPGFNNRESLPMDNSCHMVSDNPVPFINRNSGALH